jgi:hypothetical protein
MNKRVLKVLKKMADELTSQRDESKRYTRKGKDVLVHGVKKFLPQNIVHTYGSYRQRLKEAKRAYRNSQHPDKSSKFIPTSSRPGRVNKVHNHREMTGTRDHPPCQCGWNKWKTVIKNEAWQCRNPKHIGFPEGSPRASPRAGYRGVTIPEVA